jgi:hypothetical protein
MELDTTQLFYGADLDVPISYWENMPLKEKTEFIQLRNSFHRNQKTSVKDRRLVSFSNEIQAVLEFTEKNEAYRENKCVLIGAAFAGPFICVNTRQLKTFLGRCKSSINGSFQQLGYVALRTKSKARNCVLSVLPSLAKESNLLRRWSVRYASDDSRVCYISRSMPSCLPEITIEDIIDERKQQSQQQTKALQTPQRVVPLASIMQNITQQLSKLNVENKLPPKTTSAPVPKQTHPVYNNSKVFKDDGLDFDLPSVYELGLGDFNQKVEMTPSFSVGNFNEIDDDYIDYTNTSTDLWGSKWSDFLNVPRSKSAFFEEINELF